MYRLRPEDLEWNPVPIRNDPIDALIDSQDGEVEILHVAVPPNPRTQPTISEWVSNNAVETTSKPNELSSDSFIDQETIKDYECCICCNLAKRPMICSNCNCLMCSHPCLRAYKESDGSRFPCPLKCSRINIRFIPLPKEGGRKNWKTFGDLLTLCYFAPDCQERVAARYYSHHVNRCRMNPEFCLLCNMLISDQRHKRTDCVKKFRELEDSKRRKQSDELSSLKSEINFLREKIKKLEIKPIASCHSNNIRSAVDHKIPRTKFAVTYGDRKIRIAGIDLNETGATLRNAIETRLGCKVGPIMRFDHTVIKDDKKLKQHQLCYKPTELVALPINRPVEDGRILNIDITGRQEELV